MQLTFINGSPRGTRSNTAALMNHFIRGFNEKEGNNITIEYLAKHNKNISPLADVFSKSMNVIIGFPLYVDAMPGCVKTLFELLLPFAGRKDNPSLGFMIQCGFPETHHVRFVERYCEKFCRRIGCTYLGTIAKGGCEGLKIQPAFLTDKYYEMFYSIGKIFGETGNLDTTLLSRLARPEKLATENLKQVIPFINKALWDMQLAANGATEKNFDMPYLSHPDK